MKYRITNKLQKRYDNYDYIIFELDKEVEFENRKKKKYIYCLNEYPFINFQKGEEIEVDLNSIKKINSNTPISNEKGIISQKYVGNFHDYYDSEQIQGEGSNQQKILTKELIPLSAYEMETIYEFLYSSLEWLELYLEKANYYPQQSKQLPKTITRPDIFSMDSEKIKEHFFASLTGLRSITGGKTQLLQNTLQDNFFA